MSIERLIKTVRNLRISTECSLLTSQFRQESISHTQTNCINIDSEGTLTDEEFQIEKEEMIDMNIIQQILWKKKLFVIENPKKKTVDYRAIQKWMKR